MGTAPWAKYRIIDVHGHIGRFDGYDLSLQTLKSEIGKAGVSLVLISNIDAAAVPPCNNFNETKANNETARVVNLYPELLRGLLWARPEDGKAKNLEPFLEAYKDKNARNIFMGIKFHPEFNNFLADDKRVDPYMDLCAKYKIPALFHCGQSSSNSTPERIYSIGKRHPKVPVILYHMGFGTDHKAAIKVASLALQRKDALLYLETAQADPDTVLEAIGTIGSDRVLFGSDATYFGKTHYDKYEKLINALHNKLSAKEFDEVVHGNASRLFRLKG